MLGISPIVKDLTDIIVEEILFFFSKENINKTLIVNVKDLDFIYNFFSIDEVQINLGELNEYLHSKSGFDGHKLKYIAYLNLNINNLTVDSLLHEVKHIYVDWCIFKNKGNPIKNTKEVKYLYTTDFEKLLTKDKKKIPNLINLISFFYYSSKLEIPSFLENHYFNSDFYYKSKIKEMLNFKISNFNNQICREEYEIIKKYNIPRINKYKNYDDFLNYCEKFFKIRGKYIIKKINRIDFLIYKKNVK